MGKEIRVYVEGGGDGKDTKARVRQGFSGFLKDIVALAREKRIRWSITACGSRNSASDGFRTALRTHPEAFNVLLVDSEGPVNSGPCQHLKDRDGWDLSRVADEPCHLMVQVVEAWLVADIAALERFYGQGFQPNSIPRTIDVEQIDKPTLIASLKAATRMTQKGEYHKIRHGPDLLKLLDVAKVRKAAPHCERLLRTLEQEVMAP
jgi:hypothetical protein